LVIWVTLPNKKDRKAEEAAVVTMGTVMLQRGV